MFLTGYDAWKTREPDDDGPCCETCGEPLRRDSRRCWYCERCDDADYRLELKLEDERLRELSPDPADDDGVF